MYKEGPVVKLEDTHALGVCAFGREGSSPSGVTEVHQFIDDMSLLRCDQINQDNLFLFSHNMSGKRAAKAGANIGAWCAYFLSCRTRRVSSSLFVGRASAWHFVDGIIAIENLYGLSGIELERMMVKCGAPENPFRVNQWNVPPYSVFVALANKISRNGAK